jgi:hypothetical protein
MRIPIRTLLNSRSENNPLLRAVQDLIERRQATVPEGQAPYRVQIRFLVRPDGLRSYYQAYPALEALHVHMTRENIRREKDPASGESG